MQMASSLGSDLEVDKVLIWKTEIPFVNNARQSSYFSFMGLEWCLRFSYHIKKVTDNTFGRAQEAKSFYHVVTLHRVIDEQAAIATVAPGQENRLNKLITAARLHKNFRIKTCLVQPMDVNYEEIAARHSYVDKEMEEIWYGGENTDDIFKNLPFLHKCCEVHVVCKFYGQPLHSFQLQIGTGKEFSLNSWKSDKCIQASSEVPVAFQTLSNDFCNLLEKETLPDVKLECWGQIFQAHRAILAARSEVFRAMFQSKLMESETGAVKIHNLGVPVLQKLLKFIYSGKLEDPSEKNTADLYKAADMYDAVSLKTACSYWMIRNLTEGNCISYLQLASSHSDPDLKAAVISFVIGNPRVMKSSEWSSLSNEFPLLANEVFQAYIASTVQ